MREMSVAIWARGVCKRYGGKDGTMALNELNITVHKGTIYGLLGSSGCGKTTFLSSVVGSRKIDSGEIKIFGQSPGRLPVRCIGYMPQDVALVEEFSVKEVVQHYGWIHGLTDSQVKTKLDFLTKLLDLPSSDAIISDLSGGQQRRVSLAVALIHDPEVIIADEPTVGLDPVLSQKIWNHLLELAEKENKTIIITTHYIEEARQTHKIGLMRNGRLLAEGNPKSIMDQLNCSSLEEVFLQLSGKQEDGCLPEGLLDLSIDKQDYQLPESNQRMCLRDDRPFKLTNPRHAKALITKNLIKFIRNGATIAFAFGFPIATVIVFFTAVGDWPNRKFGVYDNSLGSYDDCFAYSSENVVGGLRNANGRKCNYTGLSCKFLQDFPPELSRHIYYKSSEEANEALRMGEILGFVEFNANFTDRQYKLRNNYFLSDQELDDVQINIYYDASVQPSSQFLTKTIYERYDNFSKELEEECGFDARWNKNPVHFNDPIYGDSQMSFKRFVAPGFLVLLSIFLAVSISSIAIVSERIDGVWERTLVAGVSKLEVMLYHTIVMMVISLLQNAIAVLSAIYIFQMPVAGDVPTFLLVVISEGAVGVSLGIFFSVISKTSTDCILASLGSFYPFFIMCGVAWPLEAMHPHLRPLSVIFPPTFPVQAAQSIVQRGWGLENWQVSRGLISAIVWWTGLTTASSIVLKYENR